MSKVRNISGSSPYAPNGGRLKHGRRVPKSYKHPAKNTRPKSWTKQEKESVLNTSQLYNYTAQAFKQTHRSVVEIAVGC